MTTEDAVLRLFPACVLEKIRRMDAGADCRPDKDALAAFGSDEKCRAYLEELRWPEGVRCPRCDADKGISRLERRGQFDCNSCGYQFSVRVGTVLQDSQLPSWKWVLAAFVMAESEEGISANQLKQVLGVSYKTAWYLSHRIRSSMKNEAPEVLHAAVEDDRMVPDRVHPDSLGHLLTDRVAESEETAHPNMVWTALQRALSGSYYHLSAKHLPAYVDEVAYRHKNRDNAYLLRDMLLRLIGAESMSYTKLVAGT
ncbi:MAG: transposase [Actinomycetota bacterium]|nr:transposase [Actinomycetota bacterium]